MVDKVVAEADPIPDFLQGADDYDPPHQDSDTIYGGVNVSGNVSGGGASAGGGVEAGLGAQFYANGDKTYFFRAKANARPGYESLGGGGDGTITIGVTYDKNGNEKSMTVLGVGSVAGGLELTGDGLTGVLKALAGARRPASGSSSSRRWTSPSPRTAARPARSSTAATR